MIVPPAASTASIADAEARETTIWMGWVRADWPPRARSLTPSLTPWMQRERASSRTVMGILGSMRPWFIHSWIRSRLTGEMSREKLVDVLWLGGHSVILVS